MRFLIALAFVIRMWVEGNGAEKADPPQTLRVAAVQMRSTRNLDENVAATKRHIAECAKMGARVVVFPECSVSGYFDNDYMKALTRPQLESAERAVAEACREHQVYAIVGMPVRDGEKLYNSAIVIATLEIGKATGRLAENSVQRGPLGDWWTEGIKHVRIVE
jgi:apolipoprotein N-acyltransferase